LSNASSAASTSGRAQGRELLLRYFFFGSLAVGVNVVVLTLLVEALDVHKTLASCTGFLASVCTNFVLQRRFTFRSSTPIGSGATKFLAFAIVTLAVNVALFDFLSRFIHYVPAQLAATLLMFLVNFQLNRRFTFRA